VELRPSTLRPSLAGPFFFHNQVNESWSQDAHNAQNAQGNHFGPNSPAKLTGPVVVIRPHSGLSGDIIVAGLAALAGADQELLDDLLEKLSLGSLTGRVKLEKRSVEGITGLGLSVNLADEHTHRTMADVRVFFDKARITDRARSLIFSAFGLIAQAEGLVHNLPPDRVAFHEVGAVDSLLDIGLAAALFDSLDPSALICGPLPLSDGEINCAHGVLPSPAPAVSILLEGVTVRGFKGLGETVTPTGLALLKSFGAVFGQWPTVTIERQALIFGTKVFSGAPNGCLFALGRRPATA
jgi:uncharacterized protein (DUF111 family)